MLRITKIKEMLLLISGSQSTGWEVESLNKVTLYINSASGNIVSSENAMGAILLLALARKDSERKWNFSSGNQLSLELVEV